MAAIKKFVTTAVLVLVAAVSLSSPGVSEAAQRVAAKKKPQAVTKYAVATRGVVRHASLHASVHAAKRVGARHVASIIRIEPARPSFGQLYGLHNTADSLELKSSVALVIDHDYFILIHFGGDLFNSAEGLSFDLLLARDGLLGFFILFGILLIRLSLLL